MQVFKVFMWWQPFRKHEVSISHYVAASGQSVTILSMRSARISLDEPPTYEIYEGAEILNRTG
jgi:hypothetical protein